MKRPLRFLVIGGVAAGTRAAAKARRSDPSMEITIVTEEQHISYAGCGLPYYIGGVIRERNNLFARSPETFREKQNIDIRLGCRAERINTYDRTVLVKNLANGAEETISWDRLLIATGASPLLPPIEGVGAEGVFSLHSITDADAIKSYIDNSNIRNAAIIGAGYIGVEMAENFIQLGIPVTMFEMTGTVMSRMFDPDMSEQLAEHMKSKGVSLITGTAAEKITGAGRVQGVVADGREYPADIVIAASGVKPNVSIARDARIAIGESGAIKVDRRMETSVRGIYAAGDCAESVNLVSGKPYWLPLGSTANKMGRVAGANAAGGDKTFPGVLGTSIVKVFDLGAGRTGLSEEDARRHGFNPVSATVNSKSKAGYYPGGEDITVKLIADRKSGKILGAQAIGLASVDKAVDTAAAALMGGLDVGALTAIDLAYSPPFSPALGPLIIAAQILDEKL